MNYTSYDPRSGEIMAIISSRDLANGLPVIEGVWPDSIYYVYQGKPKPYPPTPGDRSNYRWDNVTETWQFVPERASQNIRRRRNQLLAAVDRVNPIWYASLTAEQQTELQEYRAALLDITDQPGFPESVAWPTRPRWL